MKRKISVCLLAALMLCSMFSTTALATQNVVALGSRTEYGILPMAGTETWYAGVGDAGSFTMQGFNITPVKTMGDSGTLEIFGYYSQADGLGAVSLIVEIREAYTGRVIASNDGDGYEFSLSTPVTKGQKIQIYFGVKGNSSRKVSISYGYSL